MMAGNNIDQYRFTEKPFYQVQADEGFCRIQLFR